MLRWFPRFQVATTCFSCSPPDLSILEMEAIYSPYTSLNFYQITWRRFRKTVILTRINLRVKSAYGISYTQETGDPIIASFVCSNNLTFVNSKQYEYTVMRSIMTYRSTTDRIYDGGPIRL